MLAVKVVMAMARHIAEMRMLHVVLLPGFSVRRRASVDHRLLCLAWKRGNFSSLWKQKMVSVVNVVWSVGRVFLYRSR